MSSTKEGSEEATAEFYSFVPEITTTITRNGLVLVTITNMDDYWEHNEFELLIRSCLCLYYGFDQHHNKHLSQKKTIEVGRITESAQLCLRAPLFLCGYKLSFCIAAFNKESKEWMDKSEIQTIDIPSIWSLDDYKVGDKVVFKHEQEPITRNGRITHIVSDNRYKLEYTEHENTSVTECDASRIYQEAPYLLSTIYLTDGSDIIKHLFIKSHDQHCIDIYSALKKSLAQNWTLVRMCMQMYGFDEPFLIHMEPIVEFMTYNVFGYLFEGQFDHAIYCLFDVEHVEALRFVNVMQYVRQIAVGIDEMSVYNMDKLACSCDLCRTEISAWSFMFCDTLKTCINDAHHYCLHCILSTILLSDELKHVLRAALNDDLNIDCIDEIVSCLIGKVIYTEKYQQDNQHLSSRQNKRRIASVTDLMPNTKKRKLNVKQ